jgi:hypothetical protein
MQSSKSRFRRQFAWGVALPAVLVVVSALLILVVGLLLVVGIERNTARSFSDLERASLAAQAGLEDVKGLLNQNAANDNYLVIQSVLTAPTVVGSVPCPQLFLATGKSSSRGPIYTYIPLFSSLALPPESAGLVAPVVEAVVGNNSLQFTDFNALPFAGPARASWLTIEDDQNRGVARYAYWVEDLQSRVDARTAGNLADAGNHKRYGWTAGDTSRGAAFPAPGLNAEPPQVGPDGRDQAPALNQIALFALDPISTAADKSDWDQTLIEGRMVLVSPDSVLAAAGVGPPLSRDPLGRLVDLKARALEENLTASVQPYDEQPQVPFANGIDGSIAGQPKLNLNALLGQSPARAVDEMAGWIRRGLPTFEDRKGGFPRSQDYLKTLAANAIGYAAPGNQPVVAMGSYRGLGACPVLSEIVLAINYLGYVNRSGNKVMLYQFVLFGELLNHTNLPISGNAALSYEVGLNLPPIGPIPGGSRFDDPSVLGDPALSMHDLVSEGVRYWCKPQAVALAPGEYRFYKFATVNYTIDIGSGSIGSNFVLTEPLGAAGISTKWNDEEVDRIPSIVRDSTGLTFSSGLRRFFGKAAIPGHSYGPYGAFINNMGDPRIAHYIQGIALGENSFPENISPHRRNIRHRTIYSLDGSAKLKTYGRVIPSEWPDGGHDPQVSPWNPGWSESREGRANSSGTGPGFDPTIIPAGLLPQPGEAMTYLSNRGRYYSATELGRLYDPIQYIPTFDPTSGLDSKVLRADGTPSMNAGVMPAAGISWPAVQVGNPPSSWFGGGNTLRIGRPEHPKFDQPLKHRPADMPGNHAARLLDLFHAGKSRSEDPSERAGPVVRIEGHVNLNTASEGALRAMAAGFLTMDPQLSKRTSDDFDARMAPSVQALTSLSAPSASREADLVAAAIIRGRPYATPSEIACVMTPDLKLVFGNRDQFSEKNQIQWSDSAAEEVFGRVYEAATVRSRNFRVWVIGQALAPSTSARDDPQVLAEVRKVYTIFADPGERQANGAIEPAKSKVTVLHEAQF